MAQFPQELRAALGTLLERRNRHAGPLVLGVAGGVAAGKSTFATNLGAEIAASPLGSPAEIVATDGFLLPNQILSERNLSMRKGYPESYDFSALVDVLAKLKAGGPASIPIYSHVTYDVDPVNRHVIDGAEVVILDGLHLGRVKFLTSGERLIDALLYLDAEEVDIRRWFGSRLRPLMMAGRNDPASFYYGFRQMDDKAVDEFIERVWTGINLPNLREHIVKDREAADIVVRKGPDHALVGVLVKSTG